MGWIKERILAEYRKHYRVTGGLDWARLAEGKIIRQLKEDDRFFIKHIEGHLKEGEVVVCKICGKSANNIIQDTIQEKAG